MAAERRKQVAEASKKKAAGRAPDPYAERFDPVKENHENCVTEQEWRSRFFDGKSEVVLKNKVGKLTELLQSAFLHVPASAAPSMTEISVERMEPRADEVEAYNIVLSLHQRDVLRSSRGQPPARRSGEALPRPSHPQATARWAPCRSPPRRRTSGWR